MKKRIVLASLILSISIVVFAASKSYLSENKMTKSSPIASLDSKEITKELLTNYVNELALGKKYEKMLSNDEGLKKLADFYITRKILLDFADKNDYKDTHFVKQHAMSENQDDKTIMISAVLKKEINDKIDIQQEEIDAFLTETNTTDRRAAYFTLQSVHRQKLYKEFIAELKTQHDIEYMIN